MTDNKTMHSQTTHKKIAFSKFFQTFKSRCEYLSQHIQIVEVALSLVKPKIDSYQSQTTSSTKLHTALGVSPSSYSRLSKLPAKQWDITFHNHSKQRNLEFALGELYAYFEEYVRSIVDELPSSAMRYPEKSSRGITIEAKYVEQLLKSEKTLDATVGTYIIKSITSKKFGKGMAEEIANVTNIAVDQRIKHYAHFVLDIRNALIHHAGIVSKTLAKDYGSLLTNELNASVGSTIKINNAFINQAILRVSDYIKNLDNLLLQYQYILPHNHKQIAKKAENS